MVKTIVQLNIFCGNRDTFLVQDFFDEYEQHLKFKSFVTMLKSLLINLMHPCKFHFNWVN